MSLWNGNLTGDRAIVLQIAEKIISYCGAGADLLWEKDLLLFCVFMCLDWVNTEKRQIFAVMS